MSKSFHDKPKFGKQKRYFENVDKRKIRHTIKSKLALLPVELLEDENLHIAKTDVKWVWD